ncbi:MULTISPECIES: restriction endonuclease [unclassified Exiguobacterium]|uniref:nSTAND3 domain-containing NTPase n=1 Tax=unclassified Exiguobacterium TaxID=2644629 RepID=UPI001BE8CB8A|nr:MULTISPECIES: restriction endonuclease [unclassified Exiguobacterium]
MYDFGLLSDFEFEKLSADILSRKLGVKLRFYKTGRDGGIDLKDDNIQNNIVVQVKHYFKSTFSNLMISLKKEVEKVKELNPNSYYVCVSQDLSPQNIKDIYDLFSDYMEDTSHIITKNQLEEFLNQEENQDILRKNFKLWLLSDKILRNIFSNDVFLDGDILLNDIEEELHFFVQTKIFNEALLSFNESNVLMLIGAPGVGKTMNSKMLVLSFVKQGYQIRYTSDSSITKIKKAITQNPNVKEVIYLDDFLGQYYFDLKAGQDKEIISLVKFVSRHKNKVLIMNSRITILQEAKRSLFKFRNFLDENKINVKIISMDNITLEEKAMIFMNHLLKEKIPSTYMKNLKQNSSYRRIVKHPNYNPRIIEFVTLKSRYKNVKPENYVEFINEHLTDPKEIWNDEFSNKLQQTDRIFMYTLFSLTEKYIDEDILKECFNYQLKNEMRLDSTIDYFNDTKSRLGNSLIKLYEDNLKVKIGVINPSLNDYLSNQLKNNDILLEQMKESSVYIDQIERLYGEQASQYLIDKLINGDYIKLKGTEGKFYSYFYYGIAVLEIKNETYKKIVEQNFNEFEKVYVPDKVINKKQIIIKMLDNDSLFKFYDMKKHLSNEKILTNIIYEFDYFELIELYEILGEKNELNELIVNKIYFSLDELVEEEIMTIDVFEQLEQISKTQDEHPLSKLEHLLVTGRDEEAREEWEFVHNIICGRILSLLEHKVSNISSKINLDRLLIKTENFLGSEYFFNEVESVLTAVMFPEPDYDKYDDLHWDDYQYDESDLDAIDRVFER